jgi:hypothetical protein
MLKIIILSFFLTSLQTAHVSFLGMECIPDKGIIRTSLKMNYNDFIFDYRININDDQVFDPSGKIDTTVILLSKYLLDKIQISADDQNLKGKLTGIEFVNGHLNFELVYNYNKRAKNFKVKNTILTDVNRNQTNLLIFKYNDHEEGVKLSFEKTEHTFKVKRPKTIRHL